MPTSGLSLDAPARALRALEQDAFEVGETWTWVARKALRPSEFTDSFELKVGDTVVAALVKVRRGESPTLAANQAAGALASHHEAHRLAHYALVELTRNATSHSGTADALVCAAWSGGSMIQMAVVDTGVGILASLRGMHPALTDAKEAIEKSLWPHYSGAFEEGLTGSGENAGLGLFFIAEMTKLIGGRLLIASRGAALLLTGDPEHESRNREEFIDGEFAGTLVVFEIPVGNVHSYDGIMERVRELARERAPKRVSARWLKFVEPTGPLATFRIDPNEMAPETRAFAEKELESRAFKREAFVLDFAAVDVATQSWVHALLFEVLRVAWAKRTPIYVINAKPAVRSSLELVENYALAG